MPAADRPRGIAETTILMAITNAMGWAIIDWSKPDAARILATNTVLIAIGYVVLWFYWKGKNWARVLVLLGSLLSIFNLFLWRQAGIIERVMLALEAAIAFFLLYWLNTGKVRAFFNRRLDQPS